MKTLFILLSVFFQLNLFSQDLYNNICIIDEPLEKGKSSASVTAFNPVNLTGNFQDLVIFVAFPDRSTTINWPTLNTSVQYPLLGAFPDGTLLRDYVIANNNSIPIDEWYKPALDSYFDDISGGVYNVNFTFIKQANGKPYQTDHGMDYWKAKCPSCNWTQTNPVIFHGNNWNEITSEVIENIWEDNNNAFQNINAIHFVFWGLPKAEAGYGTVFPNKTYTHSNGQIILQGIEVSTQPSPQPIPHERLHLIGYISGNPSTFTGFRDRGSDRSIGGHFNMTASHDMVDHSNRGIPALHSLYGWHPMTSLDLAFLGWIKPDEILNVNKDNFSTLQQIKLADVNFSLSQQKINSGYRRVIKVMIKENFNGDLDEYFLLEYHKATLYDKNFTNYDEFVNGYGKGILVWHIKENTNIYSWSSDHYIDLETAVPYNGWFGNPIPNDSYPRNYNRPNNWNGIYSKDYDYMDDMQRYSVGTTSYWNYPPDGGRHIWETTIIPTPSIHLIGRPFSLRSDFFTDESIKGIVTNKMSDITRPSTREWGNVTIALKTHIGFLNMKREHDYMTLDIEYNYWGGDIEESSTMSGNVIIASDVIVPTGKTLTINAGTSITFLNNADLIVNGTINSSASLIIPNNSELRVNPSATLKFASGKSLTVNGILNAVGTSSQLITFTSQSGTSPSSWENIILSGSGASGSIIKYANINYGNEVQINNVPNFTISNCSFLDNQIAIHADGSTGSILSNNLSSNSTGHSMWFNNSTITCYYNVVKKTGAGVHRGHGLLFGGGSNGKVWRNDIYNVDWGIGAIWGSSPDFYKQNWSYSEGFRNNRITSCNYGVRIYQNSHPTIGEPVDYYGSSTIMNNSVDVSLSYGYSESIYTDACGVYWNGGNPANAVLQVGSNSHLYTSPYSSTNQWASYPLPKIQSPSSTASGEVLAKVNPSNNETSLVYDEDPKAEIDSLFIGISLRHENKYKEAKNYFISYLLKHPNDQRAYIELYNCADSSTITEIIQYFKALPKEASKEQRLFLSYLYQRAGDIKSAKKVNMI